MATPASEFPRLVTVNDVTLREGEEGADVAFSLEEKLDFARLLDSIGVPQIEIGYAGNSDLDRQVISRLRAGGLCGKVQTLVQAYLDNWREQCDRVLECGVDLVGVLLPAGMLRLERVHHLSNRQVLDRAWRVIRHVTDCGGTAAFIPFDATRAEIGFLGELARCAADAGAVRMVIADTVGCATPALMHRLVTEVKRASPIEVGVHCHNDLGLALANSLAALEAGASVIDASTNGLGDRCGNASLDEVVVAIQTVYGMRTGIDLSKMYHLARAAETLSHVALQPNKPLVGANAFAVRTDARLRLLINEPGVAESIPPKLIGSRYKLCLGIHTGPQMVRAKLEELALSVSVEEIERLVAAVRAEAAQQRASLTDQQFQELYGKVVHRSTTTM